MAIELEIRDGSPWWLSPDVWTVPGDDPEGSEGLPIAGQPCYLWAHVTNNGTSSVSNVVVRYYWANPGSGFDRNTATQIGTSNVNLQSGEAADVLCLTAWVPEWVNNGHECVLAEAFHSSLDPLPATADFNVTTDRHVAQRNLDILQARRGFFAFPIVLYNTLRTQQQFQMAVQQGRLDELEPLRRRLGIEPPKSEGTLARAVFVDVRCPTEELLDRHEDNIPLEISIPPNGSRPTTLIGRVDGEAALIHVGQYRGDLLVGGISVLVIQ